MEINEFKNFKDQYKNQIVLFFAEIDAVSCRAELQYKSREELMEICCEAIPLSEFDTDWNDTDELGYYLPNPIDRWCVVSYPPKEDLSLLDKIKLHYEEMGKLRRDLIKGINEICAKYDGGEINLGELQYDGVIEPVSVVYDGGNHPEYASNAFSQVNCVRTDGDEFAVDIDDANNYPCDNLSTDEICAIYEAVLAYDESKNLREK